MSDKSTKATTETSLEGVHETKIARLSTILDQYPIDPQFEGLSEDEVMAYAIQVVDEVRREHRKSAK